MIFPYLLAAVAAAGTACAEPCGVSKNDYLDLVEAAVAAYPEDHVAEYIDDADRNGVNEHGFPRLTANLAALVAAGRHPERLGQLKRMMDICCRDAKKGPMKKEGNEFSVKELVDAICDIERAGLFPKDVTDSWRKDIADVDPWRCYRVKPEVGDTKLSYNWCVFGSASEQKRISSGMGGDPAFVSRYVVDQMRWFDSNGMWRDPNEPAVYDIITRLQFALILSAGYDGPSRAELEAHLDRGAEATLAMQSAAGEIPYGGRSNQFLHNDTTYAALCEWYAARALARGDRRTAARFRSAAARAVAGMRRWLAERPVRHVKNLYPRSWERGTGIGCEDYAYFDKYMVTMGSWAVLAMRFADETPLPYVEERKAVAFETSPFFHFVFLRAGEYSAQFDYNADTHYDCDGLGRLHRRGAPTQICISTPCAAAPTYSTEMANVSSLAIVPVSDAPLVPAGSGSDAASAWARWNLGDLDWRCTLTQEGLSTALAGPASVALRLPAFAFDGRQESVIANDGSSLEVRYRGWVCRYETDGAIVDTGIVCCNRNGRYLAFEARGEKSVSVKVTISKHDAATCNAEICPERADDFCWENDKFGMRAYGPGDYHKWSGWDVFNKSADAGATCCQLLHNSGKCGNWHETPCKGIIDNYTVGASRGVGGIAFWGDGEWKTYPNWESAKVIRADGDCCEFELVYPAFAAVGKMTCHVTLKKGERFFRNDVSFEHPERFCGDFRVGPGLDLEPKRGHRGALVEEDGLVSLFEDAKGANGSTMEAVFVAPGEKVEAMTDRMNCRVLAFDRPSFTYWAGATWSKAGEITTPDEWIEAVRSFRKGVAKDCETQTKGNDR